MLAPVASLLAGAVLVAAAAAKALDPAGSRVALGGYAVPGRLIDALLWTLVAVEAGLGLAIAAGAAGAGWAGAALMSAFAGAQIVMLARGRGGAPCGCLGARGRIGAASLLRVLLVAGLCAAAAGAAAPGGPLAVLALATLGAFLLVPRRPDGPLDVAGEGPEVGARSALADSVAPGGRHLVLFTSDGCRLCRRLRPALRELERPDLAVHEFDEEEDAQAWLAASIPGSPFAVLLDGDGRVVAKGTVNTGAQLRSLAAALAPAPAAGSSRRGFLERAAGAAATLAAADTVGRLVRPGEAEAYHFCGHIYTTDSCPHPTGLPRIDARGRPLRASDGHPVDDLGRLIDEDGLAIDDDGAPLLDPDGRRLPRASRTVVCNAVAREFRIPTRTDGAWYRCCGGSVRKLVDCCSTNPTRINGDRALRGYCYKNRKVFCVMFFQTKIPC